MAQTIGELNGLNKFAFRLTIFGAPIIATLSLALFTTVGIPWVKNQNDAAAAVPHKLDIEVYRTEEAGQSRGLRQYTDDNAAEIKQELKDARLEINAKLDRLIWEARDAREGIR